MDYRLREGKVIKGEYTKEIIGDIADEVMKAISTMVLLAVFIHTFTTLQGVRLRKLIRR